MTAVPAVNAGPILCLAQLLSILAVDRFGSGRDSRAGDGHTLWYGYHDGSQAEVLFSDYARMAVAIRFCTSSVPRARAECNQSAVWSKGLDGALYGTVATAGNEFLRGGVFKVGKDGSNYTILRLFGSGNRWPNSSGWIIRGPVTDCSMDDIRGRNHVRRNCVRYQY